MDRSRVKRCVVIVGAFCALMMLVAASRNDFGLGRNMEIMINLMRTLSSNYVDKIDADKMLQHGAKGVLESLDPYTTYLSEADMKEFRRGVTGKYGGIGAMIRQDSDYVRIAEPYRNSPSDKAGLRIGDRIVAIDGVSVKGTTTSEVSSRLRGEPNTEVRVTIESVVDGKQREHRIRRERITIPSIAYADFIADGVGYIVHSDFTDRCYDEMRSAIERLNATGNLRHLILDYRNNGGGVLQSAVKLLSLFLPKGTTVVEVKGRNASDNRIYKTEYEPIVADIPLVVLINRNSASAAEIVAGALQDADRAVIIGQRSFGKGLVQSTFPVGYNNFVKVTTAKYYIPSGRCVQALRYKEDGSAESLPDSLIKEFKTRNGRKVYEGGGIKPDVESVAEQLSPFALTLYVKDAFTDFGDRYFAQNPKKEIDPTRFTLTAEEYAAFKEFVLKSNIEYRSPSHMALETLQKKLGEEKLAEKCRAELQQIEKALGEDMESLLERYRTECERLICSDLVLRYGYGDGLLAWQSRRDKEVERAIEMVQSVDEMQKILNPAIAKTE